MVFFLLNAAFAMAILDLISHVHLPSFVNMLPKSTATLDANVMELGREVFHVQVLFPDVP